MTISFESKEHDIYDPSFSSGDESHPNRAISISSTESATSTISGKEPKNAADAILRNPLLDNEQTTKEVRC